MIVDLPSRPPAPRPGGRTPHPPLPSSGRPSRGGKPENAPRTKTSNDYHKGWRGVEDHDGGGYIRARWSPRHAAPWKRWVFAPLCSSRVCGREFSFLEDTKRRLSSFEYPSQKKILLSSALRRALSPSDKETRFRRLNPFHRRAFARLQIARTPPKMSQSVSLALVPVPATSQAASGSTRVARAPSPGILH